MRMSVTDCGLRAQARNHRRAPAPPPPDPRVAFFDQRAPTWDDDADDVRRTLARLAELRGRIGLVPGQDVLEVGCGTGRITGWLVETVRPGRVVAVDFSPAMLAQAAVRRLAAEFRWLDVCGEIAAAEQFAVALCFHAFPHFRDQPRALRNLRRLRRPGGQLIILHLAGSAELNHFHSQLAAPVCHDLLPAAAAWPALLGRAGLELVSLVDTEGLFLLKAVSPPTPARREAPRAAAARE